MEGKISSAGTTTRAAFFLLLINLAVPFTTMGYAQNTGEGASGEPGPQLKLRKTIKTREYQGKTVEGEERVITPGDSLWRILIQEKGFSKKRFGRYQNVIAGLNPQIKNLDILRVGDNIFIPIKPDEILAIQLPESKSKTRRSAMKNKSDPKVYRVRTNDNLYKILREQLNLEEKGEIQKAFDEVKALNPHKTNWDLLLSGELLRLPSPVVAEAPRPLVAEAPPPLAVAKVPLPALKVTKPEIVDFDYARTLSARENLPLLQRVMEASGNQVQRSGEEVLALQDGTVRIDRSSYPVIFNPTREQKVLLDPEEKIPASIRLRLNRENTPARVVPIARGTSLQETVKQILSILGFQSLPENYPVALQDGAAALEVKGNWMVIAPEQSNRAQEILIISLTDKAGETPEYLKNYLLLKGLNFKDVIIPSASVAPVSLVTVTKPREAETPSEKWPSDREGMIDAFFNALQIPFSGPQELSVTLRKGIRLDTKSDGAFEFKGKTVALFFHPVSDEVKQALNDSDGTKTLELDLRSLTTRELIARLLKELGEPAIFGEHHLSAAGGIRDKVRLKFSGFLLASRSLFLTDREIPAGLQQLFSDKGLRVIYFQ